MSDEDIAAIKLANGSGFLLQLRIERAVRASVNRSMGASAFDVSVREHAWRDDRTGREGFVDLVLENGNASIRAVVECKRASGGAYIFLQSSTDRSPVFSKLGVVARELPTGIVRAWDSLLVSPECATVSFCVVAGQADRDRPMIERVASELICATDGLMSEDVATSNGSVKTRFYVPIIVTTAELRVLWFNPDDVELSTGQISSEKAVVRTQPYVRFTKNLSGANADGLHQDLASVNAAKDRTVFIVHAESLVDFLQHLSVDPGISTEFAR